MIKEAIIKVAKKEDLTYEKSKAVMNEIMDGETSQVQTAAYLIALAMKGETIDEITGSAEGMRSHALQLKHDMDVLEIVGTGGDGSNSFNISTTASLVIAAGGVPVAKHGNRSVSSKSGAADVLENLRSLVFGKVTMQEEIPEVKFTEEEGEDYEDFSQPVFVDGEEEEQPHVYHEEPLTKDKPNSLKFAVIAGVMITAIAISKKIKK